LLLRRRIENDRLADDAVFGKIPHVGLREPQAYRVASCPQLHVNNAIKNRAANNGLMLALVETLGGISISCMT
jgi:hypothetical protein